MGSWPPDIPESECSHYSRWLEVFIVRFFDHRFKRSTTPNGPKFGSGGSLSPRGDWRMPSNASAAIWLAELRRNVPDKAD
jgi:NAD+ synthase (glutamine-hydrolysing)